MPSAKVYFTKQPPPPAIKPIETGSMMLRQQRRLRLAELAARRCKFCNKATHWYDTDVEGGTVHRGCYAPWKVEQDVQDALK